VLDFHQLPCADRTFLRKPNYLWFCCFSLSQPPFQSRIDLITKIRARVNRDFMKQIPPTGRSAECVRRIAEMEEEKQPSRFLGNSGGRFPDLRTTRKTAAGRFYAVAAGLATDCLRLTSTE
jgi:hypothetical protein